jgi:predicted transcriptional regulator
MVVESLRELESIQQELFKQIILLPTMEKSSRKDHLKLMKTFLEKQKLFIFRMSLSDDPEAKKIRDQIMEVASMLGVCKGDSIDEFFKELEKTIQSLEEILEEKSDI